MTFSVSNNETINKSRAAWEYDYIIPISSKLSMSLRIKLPVLKPPPSPSRAVMEVCTWFKMN